jgi:hypothetical protein
MQGEDVRDSCPSSITGVASLQLPILSADLQALIEQRPCSFVDLHRRAQQELAPELWAEFDDYLRQCFLQLRELDVALLGHDLDTSLGPR